MGAPCHFIRIRGLAPETPLKGLVPLKNPPLSKGGRGAWGEDAEAAGDYFEGDGEIAYDVAIDFDGDGAGAGDADLGGLEIFDVAEGGVIAQDDGLEVADDIEVAEIFEDEDVEHAIVDPGFLEEDEGAAVVAAIADEDKGAVAGGAAAADREAGGIS